ncbi:MAG: DUF1080 domain-containing protein [Phycisphaerales bacterium]
MSHLHSHCVSAPSSWALAAVAIAVSAAPVMATSTAATADAAAAAIQLSPADVAGGWEMLFDGTNARAFRGFQLPGMPESGWTIEDGCLVTNGVGADIITKRQFGDFELVLEWSASPGGNSGIMYRVTESDTATYRTGPEYQILDDAGFGDGVPADSMNSAGAIYAIAAPPADKPLRPAGEFNEARVRLKDGLLSHFLNGVKVAEMDMDSGAFSSAVAASKFNEMPGFAKAAVGHIALQSHGAPIRFRNIRIRSFDAPMPGEIDLLAGDRMDQWTHHLNDDNATMADVWSIDDGVLRCAGNPVGYMRTNATYQDYVIQLEWRFDPEKGPGNSGVLLRMIEEDKVWPRSVEAQLFSGAAGDFWNIGDFPMTVAADRTRGRNTQRTGTNERPLGAWNHYEIIVSGGDVVLNVNGQTLNSAADVMQVPGFICLQSEGAYIEFRRVRLSEIDG